jgi:hypothetical protein
VTTNLQRLASALLALGGVAFIVGGITHPSDSGAGSKTEQLHEMLVDPAWYPSHAVLLLGMVGFAAGAMNLRSRPGLPTLLVRLLRATTVMAWVAVLGMAVHFAEGFNADAIADGEMNWFARVQVVNETVIDSAWALCLGAVAVVGGATGRIGNAIVGALGLVGATAFALASATIAWTDRFDVLFPIGGLLGVWAVLVGLGGMGSLHGHVRSRPAARAGLRSRPAAASGSSQGRSRTRGEHPRRFGGAVTGPGA